MLEQMTKRLLSQQTVEEAVARILDDAMALNGAEYGTFQLAAGEHLVIVAHRGFRRPFLDVFRVVVRDHGSACGRALRTGKTVVIEDVEKDDEFSPFRSVALAAGYRSVVTTPLVRHGGDLLGVVATHFVNVHRPTEIEIETFERYSSIAAAYLSDLLDQQTLPSVATRMNYRLCGDSDYPILAVRGLES